MSSAGGYPEQLTRASDGSIYASVAAMDVWGHATLVYEGGATASSATVILARGYDQATGLALSTEADHGTASALVHLLTTRRARSRAQGPRNGARSRFVTSRMVLSDFLLGGLLGRVSHHSVEWSQAADQRLA